MKKSVRFPIRLKIMVVLLASITVVVGLITFTMARFFHEDKRAYVNDWVSITALTTADEGATDSNVASRTLVLRRQTCVERLPPG